jgi:OFA family oxalate/formate antiporter-like MFS transporter
MVFVLASAVNALAAVMALFVLKPMRSRLMEANSAETAMPSRPAVTLAE